MGKQAILIIPVLFGIILIGQADADESSFRLLKLNGDSVKWGKPELGTGAVVTYALAERKRMFPKARNCRGLVPVAKLLARQNLKMTVFKSELKQAFKLWETVSDISFQPTDDPEKADLLIGAQMHPTGRAFANVQRLRKHPAAQLGIDASSGTTRSSLRKLRQNFSGSSVRSNRSQPKKIGRSLICLNPERHWKVGFDGNLEIYDLRYTLAHEIGHAIGLDHPGAYGQLMSYGYSEEFRGLQPGDIEGVVKLYGKRGSVRSDSGTH